MRYRASATVHAFVRSVVCVALLVAAAAGGDEAGTAPGRVELYEGVVPHTDPERAVLLVRDDRTRRPIAGARVSRHPEMVIGARGWAPCLGVAVTDRFGLAALCLPLLPGDAHWVAEAPGYAANQTYGLMPQRAIDLEPGVARHGQVIGIDGRPCAGACVEVKLGCAHSPAVVATRTDQDGRFRVAPIMPGAGDVVVSGPGLSPRYFDVDLARPGERPTQLYMFPGRRVTGRVVPDASVSWLAPAGVHAEGDAMRGVTCLIERDGHFRLEGVDPAATLQFHGAQAWSDGWSDAISPCIALSDVSPDVPLIWRLNRHAQDDADESTAVPVTVRVRTTDRAVPLASLGVHFDGEADGRRTTVQVREEAEELELPAGVYRVQVGEVFDTHAAAPLKLRLVQGQPTQLVAVAAAQPKLLLAPIDGAPMPEKFYAAVGADVAWGDLEDPVHVPATGEVWVRLLFGDRVAHARAEAARDGVRRVRFSWPAPASEPAPAPKESTNDDAPCSQPGTESPGATLTLSVRIDAHEDDLQDIEHFAVSAMLVGREADTLRRGEEGAYTTTIRDVPKGPHVVLIGATTCQPIAWHLDVPAGGRITRVFDLELR